MSILEEIVAHKKREVAQKKRRLPFSMLQARLSGVRSRCYSLFDQLNKGGFHLICEVKKASPSAGIIRENFDPVAQARTYWQGGAAAISVLTEEKYFQGSLDHLRQVRQNIALPLLRKDFIVDHYQIMESRLAGADLILLIARILSPAEIQNFMDMAEELGLEVLIEINEADELQRLPKDVVKHRAIIGVNNRDLSNFQVDIQRSLRLRSLLPEGLPLISESGIRSGSECRLLYQNGYSGALVGESMMRTRDPVAFIARIKEEVYNDGLS